MHLQKSLFHRLLASVFLSVLVSLCLFPILTDVARAENGSEQDRETVNMDFDQVNIKVFIKFISKLTDKNFVIDDKVRGKVTVLSPSPVNVDEAYEVFQSVLEVHGYTTIPSGDAIKITRTVDSRHKDVPTTSGQTIQSKPGDKVITQIIPLEHADSSQVRKILTPMVSKQGLLVAYDPTDTLILTDFESNVQRIKKIIREVDVKTFEGEISIAQLQNASAKQVSQNINELIGKNKKKQGGFQMEEVKLIPDERTNSIIILANQQDTTRLKKIIDKLDRPAPQSQTNIRIVSLANAQAEKMAEVLSSLAKGKSDKKGKQLISENVSIVADKPSNSLVIIAEPKEFNNLTPIIQKLDSPRKQVYIEAAIIEVSSDDSLNLGVNWQGGGKINNGEDGFAFGSSNGFVDPRAENAFDSMSGSLGSNGLSFGMLSFPFTYDNQKFFSLGSFLDISESDNRVNIISTPQLMTMENEEAKVVIAENRPFTTSREITESEREYSNIDYKDVGVTLKVNPLINNKGWIKMELYQEVSRVDTQETIQSREQITPTTRKRTAETTVSVKDGRTVVIAGLMQNKNTENETKIPLLGDIPLLGYFFKSESKEKRQTNLMIFITPKVIQTPEDAQKNTSQKSKILDQLNFNTEGEIKAMPQDFIHSGPQE